MTHKPLAPICKAFLVCSKIDGNTLTLIGKSNWHRNGWFPSSCPLLAFVRLKEGHGQYAIEVQLHDGSGAVVWRPDKPSLWSPKSPLEAIEGPLSFTPIFPGPGEYYLVLTANDEEVGREPFYAQLTSPIATK
jgi:hypothetical protein